LEAFYAQDLPVETLVAGREAVFAAARAQFSTEILPTLNYPDSFSGYAELPTNNAWMLANYRYNLRLDAFAQVYESLSGDWSATLAVFRDAADAERPFDYLDNWLRSNTDED
jgi:predicted aminopeptidase